jgi:hypothetical protein
MQISSNGGSFILLSPSMYDALNAPELINLHDYVSMIVPAHPLSSELISESLNRNCNSNSNVDK